MSVLTLAGKAIDWSRPPKPTAKVMWSNKDTSGRNVTGSLRTIAHLDHLNNLARKKFNAPVVVIQPPFNTSVAASAGTHDFDACLDVYIPGVAWLTQQAFFRANGAGAYYRSREQGFSEHIHYFTLPPANGGSPSDDYAAGGFKVGKFVDGGYSLYGRAVASSQVHDYYARRNALADHALDTTWFPNDIEATIFDLDSYITRQRINAMKGETVITTIGSHGPLARLGGKQGQVLWDEWERHVGGLIQTEVRHGRTTVFAGDTNKHGGLPKFGAGFHRIGGAGIDLIGLRSASTGAVVRVLSTKRVDLDIDGHDGFGVKVRVKFPGGKARTFWIVQANLGRKYDDPADFRRNCWALRKAFGTRAVYHFNEIDEADTADERTILREVFPEKHFAASQIETMVPVLVGKKNLRIVSSHRRFASPGMAKVSPRRLMTVTQIGPR